MAPGGAIVPWSSAAIVVSDFTIWVVVSLVAAAVVLALVFYQRKPALRKLRITIHSRERVVIDAGGRRPRNCPACRTLLEDGSRRARCEVNPSHEIHEDCRQLVKGICPTCRGKLA